MASELRVNTIKDASGNNSVATSFVANGSAKAWINFNGASTGAVGDYDRDSFNIAVILDNGSGSYNLGFTTNMGNANYCVSGSALNTVNHLIMCTGGTLTASTVNVTTSTTAAFGDNSQICASIDGDLA